jgi:hypothetical protein
MRSTFIYSRYSYTGHKTQSSRIDMVAIMRWIYGAARHVCTPWNFRTKSPETTCTSNASTLQNIASDADTNFSLPIGWIWTKFHTLNRMYAFRLVKLKEDILLTNLATSGSHLLPATHKTPLKRTWGDLNCAPPRFLAQTNKIPNSTAYSRGYNLDGCMLKTSVICTRSTVSKVVSQDRLSEMIICLASNPEAPGSVLCSGHMLIEAFTGGLGYVSAVSFCIFEFVVAYITILHLISWYSVVKHTICPMDSFFGNNLL